MQTIRDTIKSGDEITVRILNYKRSGTPFWNMFTLAPMKDSDGTIRFLVGVQVRGWHMHMQGGTTAVDFRQQPLAAITSRNVNATWQYPRSGQSSQIAAWHQSSECLSPAAPGIGRAAAAVAPRKLLLSPCYAGGCDSSGLSRRHQGASLDQDRQ